MGAPPAEQEGLKRLVNNAPSPVAPSPEERAAIAASKTTAERGEFATDEQVRAAWAKHHL